MNRDALLADVQARSVRVYLRLQQLTLQGQHTQTALTECQQELLRLDGEERALVALSKDDTDGQ